MLVKTHNEHMVGTTDPQALVDILFAVGIPARRDDRHEHEVWATTPLANLQQIRDAVEDLVRRAEESGRGRRAPGAPETQDQGI